MTENNSSYNKIKIAICGPVDAGKSTLVGVLTSGQIDDGRGLMRSKILRLPHEKESGRTSYCSINQVIYTNQNNEVSLDSNTNTYNNSTNIKFTLNKKEKSSIKKNIINLIDLAGHEKYLKTTVTGITGMFIDYGIIVIGANTQITRLTREHLGILLHLNIPIIIIITKIDLAPKNIFEELLSNIKKLLENKIYNKTTLLIDNDNMTGKYINKFINNKDIIPIIPLSNKSGENIINLHKILYNLNFVQKNKLVSSTGSIVFVDASFTVSGIGLVVSGIIKGEPINNKQKMWFGPYQGQYHEVTIRSIHNSISQNVESVTDSEFACFAIKPINNKINLNRKKFKKGTVLISDMELFKNNIKKTFNAEVTILHHNTTIRDGYAPVIHLNNNRQSAKIKIIDKKFIRSGEKANILFEFAYYPVFIEVGNIFFFRDGNTKGVGHVISI